MGKVTILQETTKYPITLIGRRAGACWGADITDDEKNYKRGIDCLESNHGRTFEYVNIEAVLEGYSARVIREWYTHIGCLPTRLQESTRYVKYDNFEYITPYSISKNESANKIWKEMMSYVRNTLSHLYGIGIPKEDVALGLPIGMTTKIVDKRNLRNVIDMSHQRMCNRANWEFRQLFNDYISELRKVSSEWEYIIDNYFFHIFYIIFFISQSASCTVIVLRRKVAAGCQRRKNNEKGRKRMCRMPTRDRMYRMCLPIYKSRKKLL